MRYTGLVWLLVAAVVCVPAWGTEFRSGDVVTIAAEEVIDDDLIAGGRSVLVEGTVKGDLLAFGETVRVPGTVMGGVIGVGRTVDVSGDVRGSVRGAGQNFDLSGDIGRNAAVAGQNVTLSSTAHVGQDVHAAGQSAILDGRVGRDLHVAAQSVELDGQLGRRAVLYADTCAVRGSVGGDMRFEGESLSLEPGSRVGGDLVCRSRKGPSMAEGATVEGEVTRLKPRVPVEKPAKKRRPYVPALIFFLVVFVNGVIGMAVAPRVFVAGANAMATRPWWNLLIGFLALCVVPVAAIIACFTLIGLPVGLLTLALWGLALLLSGVPVGTFVGQALLGALRGGRRVSPYWALLVGLLILMAVGFIPFLGTLTKVATVLFGVGVLTRAAKGMLVEMRAPAG